MASYNQRKERANYWEEKTRLKFPNVLLLISSFVFWTSTTAILFVLGYFFFKGLA